MAAEAIGEGQPGFSHNHQIHLTKEMSRDDGLGPAKTNASIPISPELLERLYLAQNAVKSDLPKTFANPSPIAIVGFVISLGPLSCDLMGWRGAGGSGAASIPAFFFFGGVLMMLGGLLEFFRGNTFPFIVFCTFGAFYPTFGATLLPQFNAYAAYAPPDATSPSAGLQTQGFNASIGFFTLSMTMICFIFLLCSIRTNIVFVIIFLTLVLCLGLITGAYWALASDFNANLGLAGKLQVGAGACAFVTTACGWWLLMGMALAAVDFPYSLPMGDLSTLIRGASERLAETTKV